MSRLFTPEEANRTLPLVRRIVSDILAAGQRAKALHAQLGPNAGTSPAFHDAMTELAEMTRELEAIGCTFRDWNYEVGLVDFPAIIEGEEVLLCWRNDEPRVMFYHPVNAGYAGRRPIPGSHAATAEPG